MSYADPRIQGSEDELEDGEIVNSSESELEEGEIVSDSDDGEVTEGEGDGVDEDLKERFTTGSEDTLEEPEEGLEEGEIASDVEDGGTGASGGGTGATNGEAREWEEEAASFSGHEQNAMFDGGDEGGIPDREVDEESVNINENNGGDNDDSDGTDVPPSPDAVEPATDEEWNRYVDVIQEQETRVRKFNIIGYQVEFALSAELADAENLPETLERLIQRKIDESEEKALEAGFEVGWIGMAFFVDGMDHEFLVPFRPKLENNARKLSAAMAEYDQSEKGFKIFGKRIALKITVIRQPVGAGMDKAANSSASSNVKTPRGRPKEVLDAFSDINPHALIRVPRSDDGLCLFKAVCAGMVYTEGGANKMRDTQRFLHNENKLFVEVRRLMEGCRISPGGECYGIADAKKVQAYLHHTFPFKYRLVIFGKYYGTDPCYNGNINAKHTLALYHADGHFDAVKTPQKLFMAKAWCPSCESTFNRPVNHGIQCKIRCKNCCRMGVGFPAKCRTKDVKQHVGCVKCNKIFQSPECFEAHKGTTCNASKRCLHCEVIYSKYHGHDCELRWCMKHLKRDECWSSKLMTNNHMEPMDDFKEKDYRIIAYDFECTIHEKIDSNKHLHNVNFISALVTCTKCISKGIWKNFDDTSCRICGPSKKRTWAAWSSENPLKEFTEWMLRGDESMNEWSARKWRRYPTYAYAHNASKYDTHFVLRTLYMRQGKPPKVLSTGNKLLQVSVPKTKSNARVLFRDSCLLFPMKLEKVPKTFDLPIKPKGHFPHRANKKQNYGKVLPHLPDADDYIPISMGEAERAAFEEWHRENQQTTKFDLCRELEEYCVNDSTILLHGLVEFRRIFGEIGQCDLFPKYMTITGACLRIFKKRFLKTKTFHNPPNGGYSAGVRQSEIALKWYKWLAAEHNITIRYRDSPNGEVKIGPYWVDGYIDKAEIASGAFTKCSVEKYDCPLCAVRDRIDQGSFLLDHDVALEFHGCVWHGCSLGCFPNDVLCPNQRTSSENLQRTEQRQKRIEHEGNVTYFSVQECQLREEIKRNERMREFFETKCWDSSHIDPRDGFSGGRVHPTRMYCKPTADEVIKYYDVCSLYPYVLRKEYPVGAPPQIITWKDTPWSLYEEPWNLETKKPWRNASDLPWRGLYKVRVLPPQDLTLPVLPLKDDNRLLFPLCRTCAVESRKVHHYREPTCAHSIDQRAFVVTTTDVELGDALGSGYTVLNFIETWHFPEWSDDVFKGYMNEFLRIKVEASGWKKSILEADDPEAAKDEFIRTYREREGIEIRKEMVANKPGLRYIAKQCANSLWGRFAMRPDRAQVEIVRKVSRLTELLNNRTIDVLSVLELNEETVRVSYRYRKRMEKEDENSNIIAAIYTTAYGRTELLKYMRAVEQSHPAGDRHSKLAYNDTDSVVFVCRAGKIPIPVGSFLGEMEDEYPDKTIAEFICGGNKNYAMKLVDAKGNEEILQKVRGITFNSEASKVLSYNVMKHMVLGQPNLPKLPLPNTAILRDYRSRVYHVDATKDYQVGCRKGWIDKDLRIWPYGYNKSPAKECAPPRKRQKRCSE